MTFTFADVRLWLVILVAFFTGMYLGIAHVQRGDLQMADRWTNRANLQAMSIPRGIPPTTSREYVVLRECSSEVSALGHEW